MTTKLYKTNIGEMVSWTSKEKILFGIVFDIQEKLGNIIYYVAWDDTEFVSFYVNDEIDAVVYHYKNLKKVYSL